MLRTSLKVRVSMSVGRTVCIKSEPLSVACSDEEVCNKDIDNTLCAP